jgi:hypothetical protein
VPTLVGEYTRVQPHCTPERHRADRVRLYRDAPAISLLRGRGRVNRTVQNLHALDVRVLTLGRRSAPVAVPDAVHLDAIDAIDARFDHGRAHGPCLIAWQSGTDA